MALLRGGAVNHGISTAAFDGPGGAPCPVRLGVAARLVRAPGEPRHVNPALVSSLRSRSGACVAVARLSESPVPKLASGHKASFLCKLAARALSGSLVVVNTFERGTVTCQSEVAMRRYLRMWPSTAA